MHSQILKTLTDQIQTITPLKQSYKSLQKYYNKLTTEYQELKYSQESDNYDLTAKLRYIEEVNRQVQQEFDLCCEQLRKAEQQRAHVFMEKNQALANSESLEAQLNLQYQEKANIEKKRRDLVECNHKMQFNISKYYEMIQSLKFDIERKEQDNCQIQKQIKKMELVNTNIEKLNLQVEQSVKIVNEENLKVAENVKQLEQKIMTYQKLIDNKQKVNKRNTEMLIKKTQELQQLQNRKDYISHMVSTQIDSQKQLNAQCCRLDSLYHFKVQQLEIVKRQNKQLCQRIAEQDMKRQKEVVEKNRLREYLFTLVQTNQMLFRQLQKSCSQDRKVQILLSEKLDKLMLVNDKIADTEIFRKVDLNGNSGKFTLDKNRLSRSEREPMSTTWNSSKENEK